MKLSEPRISELQNEAAKTRKYHEIVPSDSFDWKQVTKKIRYKY